MLKCECSFITWNSPTPGSATCHWFHDATVFPWEQSVNIGHVTIQSLVITLPSKERVMRLMCKSMTHAQSFYLTNLWEYMYRYTNVHIIICQNSYVWIADDDILQDSSGTMTYSSFMGSLVLWPSAKLFKLIPVLCIKRRNFVCSSSSLGQPMRK